MNMDIGTPEMLPVLTLIGFAAKIMNQEFIDPSFA